jgi:hypothetical protein
MWRRRARRCTAGSATALESAAGRLSRLLRCGRLVRVSVGCTCFSAKKLSWERVLVCNDGDGRLMLIYEVTVPKSQTYFKMSAQRVNKETLLTDYIVCSSWMRLFGTMAHVIHFVLISPWLQNTAPRTSCTKNNNNNKPANQLYNPSNPHVLSDAKRPEYSPWVGTVVSY